jgi:hypothetical protein
MRLHTRRHIHVTIVILLTAVVVLSTASITSANTRVPGGNLPYYARIGRGEIYHTEEWAVIIFYRPPTCIPEDFDLLSFFDIPGAFSCNPPTTTGFEIWPGEPGIGIPSLVELHEQELVPVWFVSWSELRTSISDGTMTILELKALPSLITGYATNYHETLRPTEQVRMSSIAFNGTAY